MYLTPQWYKITFKMSEKQEQQSGPDHNGAGGRKAGGSLRNRKCDPLMTLRGAIYVQACVNLAIVGGMKFSKCVVY